MLSLLQVSYGQEKKDELGIQWFELKELHGGPFTFEWKGLWKGISKGVCTSISRILLGATVTGSMLCLREVCVSVSDLVLPLHLPCFPVS